MTPLPCAARLSWAAAAAAWQCRYPPHLLVPDARLGCGSTVAAELGFAGMLCWKSDGASQSLASLL